MSAIHEPDVLIVAYVDKAFDHWYSKVSGPLPDALELCRRLAADIEAKIAEEEGKP